MAATAVAAPPAPAPNTPMSPACSPVTSAAFCGPHVRAKIDDRGTIADVPEWNLVDWSSIFLTGRSSILTGLWARSLAEFAELAEATGNPGGSQWARDLHAAAAIGYEDFWDAERSVYVDHIIDGAAAPAVNHKWIAGLQEILGHGSPHDAEPDKADRLGHGSPAR